VSRPGVKSELASLAPSSRRPPRRSWGVRNLIAVYFAGTYISAAKVYCKGNGEKTKI
jgi:hypothetical protein